MLTHGEQDRLTGEILRTSYEAVTLEELGTQGLPLLARLLDTSTSLLYQCNEQREIIPIAGSLTEACCEYGEHYYPIDPTQRAAQRLNPWIMHAPSVPEWNEFLRHPVHTEFLTHFEFDNYIHLRLSDCGMHDPGMVGIVLARTSKQPDFTEKERMILTNLLPALEALTRRSARLEKRIRHQPFLESILNSDSRPKIALDLRGTLLWVSERAEALLITSQGGTMNIPDALVQAARRLGLLTGKNPTPAALMTSVAIPRPDIHPLRADLHLARTRNGAYFIIAELEDLEIPASLKETAMRYQLTSAETQVFGLISHGLSNREIGRRLFISMPTVHSHVTRILSKLGVESRVQAALIAHGHKPRTDPQ